MEISQRIKRISIVAAFVLVVILLAWGIYTLFFKTSPIQDEDIIVIDTLTGLPIVGEGGDRIVIPDDIDPTSLGGGSDLPFIRSESDIVKDVTNISNQQVSGVSMTSNGDLNFYNKEDGKFYKYVNGEMQELSDKIFHNVDQVVWSNNGDRVILEYRL
jgi:hypothetical protein